MGRAWEGGEGGEVIGRSVYMREWSVAMMWDMVARSMLQFVCVVSMGGA